MSFKITFRKNWSHSAFNIQKVSPRWLCKLTIRPRRFCLWNA